MTYLPENSWWLIISILVWLLISITETAFVASDKVRYVLDKKNNGVFNHMLNTIYNHPRQFLTTLALGNIILLGWIIYLFIEILDPALMTFALMKKEAVRYFFIIVVISLLTVAANQFIPRMILRKNPDGWIKIFAIPAFLYYILIYPLTRAFIQVSRFLLKIFGCSVKPIQNVIFNEKELDSYVKLNIEDIPNDNDVDTDVKIFRNALDFSTKRVKDCMIPRADIIAVRNDTNTEILKEKFIETGLSRILVFEDNIDNIIGYIHIWELFNDPENWTKWEMNDGAYIGKNYIAKAEQKEVPAHYSNVGRFWGCSRNFVPVPTILEPETIAPWSAGWAPDQVERTIVRTLRRYHERCMNYDRQSWTKRAGRKPRKSPLRQGDTNGAHSIPFATPILYQLLDYMAEHPPDVYAVLWYEKQVPF